MNEQFIADIAQAVMEKLAGGVIKNVPQGSTAVKFSKQPFNGNVGVVEQESDPTEILKTLAGKTVQHPVGSKPRGFWGDRLNTYAKNKGFSPEQIRGALAGFIPTDTYANA